MTENIVKFVAKYSLLSQSIFEVVYTREEATLYHSLQYRALHAEQNLEEVVGASGPFKEECPLPPFSLHR